MSIANTFSVPAEFDVDVYGDSGALLGNARLRVGGPSGTSLTFRRTAAFHELDDGTPFDRLLAKTVEGQVFTLFHCQYHSYRVYIAQVIGGETTDAFTEVSVRFTRLTEWFLSGQRIRGEPGEALAWEGRPDDVNVEVNTPYGMLEVRITVETSLRPSGDDTVVTDQVWVSVGAATPFRIADARERCRELSIFLTILLGQPVDILEMTVGSGIARHHAWVQYFKPETEDGDGRGWSRFLMRRAFVDGRWKVLLENYYQSAFRMISWTRVAGMLRYDGFWEFRFFGYVSVLDGVVKLKAGDVATEVIGPSKAAIHALRGVLATMTEPLSPVQAEEVISRVRQAFTRESVSFGGCYRRAVDATDQGVVDAINITHGEFKVIKETRDAIAHGDNMALSEKAFDDIPRLTNKVALLLSYWAMQDFGITAGEFLDCLHQTHNPLAMGACVDRVALDRARDHAEFHVFTDSAFDALPASRGLLLHVCFTQRPGEGIEYSDAYSAIVKTLMKQGKLAPADLAEAIGFSPDRVKMSGPAYIECGKRVVELVWVYIVAIDDMSPPPLEQDADAP
ncbi:hypothetical protein [Luteibacter aegosomatissinici]|uniref:ApeA N-terminal domain 1-containing protein n=1 Tax=Luteibacter aegosomatissinici TaxID=2911539 RepID=UPI001FFBDABF|nr:hypothetical protein [Luteibacter aegosomatissinici]UPG92685.1 hypothetical protein L2Y97_12495 [Luteibacter aegosomatissinici]